MKKKCFQEKKTYKYAHFREAHVEENTLVVENCFKYMSCSKRTFESFAALTYKTWANRYEQIGENPYRLGLVN